MPVDDDIVWTFPPIVPFDWGSFDTATSELRAEIATSLRIESPHNPQQESAMPTRFNIGDRVRVIENDADGARVRVGDVGTIISLFSPRNTQWIVRMDNPRGHCAYDQGSGWVFSEQFLAPETPQQFQRKTFGELRAMVRAVMDNAPNNMAECIALVEYQFQLECLKRDINPHDRLPSTAHRIWRGEAKIRVSRFLDRLTQDGYCWDHNSEFGLLHPDVATSVRINGDDVFVHMDTATTSCSECDNNFLDGDVTYVEEQYFCRECYRERGFYLCSSCGEHREFSCDDCPEEEDDESSTPQAQILSHSANPMRTCQGYRKTDAEIKREINGGKKENLFFGIELEVLTRRSVGLTDAAQAVVNDLSEYAILKHDGSIGAGGFEIVTVPATRDYHKQVLWNKFFKPLDDNGKNGGAWRKVRSWNTGVCGLHIHFSREALSPMALGKFLVFMHEPQNSAFLGRIAGRTIDRNARWCKQRQIKLAGSVVRDSRTNEVMEYRNNTAMGMEVERGISDHYYAACISRTTGYKTVEVRIFRGNSSRHGVMRALDFVAALIDFCQSTPAGDYIVKAPAVKKVRIDGASYIRDKILMQCNGVSFKAFLHWFNQPQNRANYPDLWRQLIALQLLETEHSFKTRTPLGLLIPHVLESEPEEVDDAQEDSHRDIAF